MGMDTVGLGTVIGHIIPIRTATKGCAVRPWESPAVA